MSEYKRAKLPSSLPRYSTTMKSPIICMMLAVLAVASIQAKNIGYIPNLPDITSKSLPLKQWHAQDEEGRANLGYSYPGQAAANVRNSDGNMAGSWAYVDPEGKLVRVSYTADQRGFLVSSTNESPAVASSFESAGQVQENSKLIAGKKGPITSPISADESRCDCGCTEDQKRSDLHTEKKEISQPNFKMVGSEEACPNQYPFMVALVELEGDDEENPKYGLACGGSLITPTKILTAAHCVTVDNTTKPIDAGRFQVRLGMHTLSATENDAEQSRNVHKIKIHANYDWRTMENDVAILTLDSPVKYTKTISPICLPPACFVGDNTVAIGMGWGHTKSGGENSEFLRHANLKIVSNVDCQAIFKEDDDIVDHMMCAYAHGKDTCQNDSGGPLVAEYPEAEECRFMQLGIVSYGDKCGKKGSPGVYMRVASFLPWIEKHTQV